MSLPKRAATNVRYLPSSAFSSYVTFIDPNQGQEIDGTVNPPATVVQNIHANVQPWRSKEVDKSETRVGQSAYKVVVHYPKTYSLNSGMQMQITRGTTVHLLNIESLYDPDMQGVEMHIWGWEDNATT